MLGYYKKPEATAEVMKEIDGEKWFCTGDVGKLVDGPGGLKFLKITDRKKELFKMSVGKYVAPQSIENKFKEDFLIEQIMVVGEYKKFVAALIVPALEALKDWCTQNKIPFTNLAEVVKLPEVEALFETVLERHNPYFAHHEQLKKFKLISSVWEPTKADGSEAELTPTMKLKRRVIMQKYAEEVEGIYAG